MTTEREVIEGGPYLQEIAEFANDTEVRLDYCGPWSRVVESVSAERYLRDVRYLFKVIKELKGESGGQG